MNRILPERIITCDCCASYGMIKQCKLPKLYISNVYKM